MARKYTAQVAGKSKAVLRQVGTSEVHPADCGCRRCRRMRAPVARRVKPRYGQGAQ